MYAGVMRWENQYADRLNPNQTQHIIGQAQATLNSTNQLRTYTHQGMKYTILGVKP